MSDYPICFICTTVAKPRFYSIVKGVTKHSSTPFSQCLSQVLGDADCIVIAENDMICDNCHYLINEKDRISAILAQYLRRKNFNIDYPIIEIATKFDEDVDEILETDHFEDAVQITIPGQQETEPTSPPNQEEMVKAEFEHSLPEEKTSAPIHTTVVLEPTSFNYVKINSILATDPITPEVLTCDLCKARFQFKTNLITHMNSKHLSIRRRGDLQVKCCSCQTHFPDAASFEKHLVPSVRGIENHCVLCKCSFNDDIKLKKHYSDKHPECNSENITDNVKLIYSCMCCGSEVESYSEFGRHRRRHKPKFHRDTISTEPLILTPTSDNSSQATTERRQKKRSEEKRNKSPDTSICLDDRATPAYSSTDCDILATEKKIFECGLCSNRLESVEELQQHFKTHTQFKMSCKECQLVMFSASEFKHHQSCHWKQGMVWKCNTCSLTYTEKSGMISHLKVAHLHKYECSYCGELFSRKLNFVNHEKNHPESKKYVCSACGVRFQQEVTLKRHFDNNHGSPVCTHCGTQFQSMKLLKRHECSLDPSRPMLKCSYCSKEFKSRSGLRDHKLIHTGNHKYSCSQCEKQFSSKRTYQEHVNAMHSENPKTLYTCETCGKLFMFLHSYINHVKKHKEPFSYICEHCGQVINTPGFVQVHLRKHTSERPFQCTYCSKAYTNGSYLRRHLMSHTKEYAYECQDCGKGFMDRKPYLTHREKEHNDPSGSETCDICRDMDSIGKHSMFIIHRHRVHGEQMPKKVTTVKLSTQQANTASSSRSTRKGKGKNVTETSDVNNVGSETFTENLDCDISQTVEIATVDYFN